MARATSSRSATGVGPCFSIGVPTCPHGSIASSVSTENPAEDPSAQEASQRDTLQTLLAFSALHEQVHQRKTPENCHGADKEDVPECSQFKREQFVLDEVLQLVAERALAITGADGLAIALAENEEIVSRAVAGSVRPDVGMPIDRNSGFSRACFSTAQIWRCDDTETDTRVSLRTCQSLGARSIVAIPLRGRCRAIGLLAAFSVDTFGFSDSDVLNLSALSELVVGAMDPEEEDRIAASAQLAATKLEKPSFASDALTSAAATVAPVEMNVAFSTVTVHEQPFEPVTTSSNFGTAAATETPNASAIAAEKPDVMPYESKKLTWLICMVIALLFAAAAWWGMKIRLAIVSKQAKISRSGLATNLPIESLNRPSQMLTRVTEIRHVATADSISVVVDLEDQVQYDVQRLVSPDRIYLDLRDTTLASNVAAKPMEVHDSLIKAIRVGQPAVGITRIVLVTKDRANFSVRVEPNPYRLVIELRRGATTN